MTTDTPSRKSGRPHAFLRACRYLWPHRWIVAVSILCALVVGGIFTAGLSTLLPIMQVLLNGDTIANWAQRQIVQQRLGVRLAEEPREVRPVRVRSGGPAAAAGLAAGPAWQLPGAADDPEMAGRLLSHLARPEGGTVRIEVDHRPVDLTLEPLPAHLRALGWAAGLMPTDGVRAIAAVLGFILVLTIFGNTTRFFQEYYSEKAAILAVRDLRKQVYGHALRLRLTFFGQHGTSDLTHRLTQDAQGLQDGLKGILGNSIQEPIKAAMALGLALFLSWRLTLFIIIFAPVMMVIIRKFGKHVRRAARAALQSSAAMLGRIESTLAGIRVVKASGAETHERRLFTELLAALSRRQLRIARIEAFNTPTFEMLTLVVVCCIVLYAAWLVLVARSLDATTFLLVMACLVAIGESLRKTTKINNIVQKANAAAARMFEVLDLPAERARRAAGPGACRPLPPVSRDIVFESVTFTYPGAASPALRDVSFAVQRGQSIAVVGRNGSGKTTLLALLPRFYDPDSGRILIDGTDIRQATLGSLRRQISIVTQDSVLFPGTIAQNIAYANPRATREQIEDAARRAFAHDFIMARPLGYDTPLGEGPALSGGEKQRLCIARAILRATPILILDEATSQVDGQSEALIQRAIEALMHERTTFVIAHRFSTIRSADRILVLEGGALVGSGGHEELLAGCEVYRALYEHQLPAGAGVGS